MPSIPVEGWTPPTEKQCKVRDEWLAEAKYYDPEWAKEHGLDRDNDHVTGNAWFSQCEVWRNWGEGLDDDYGMDPPIVFDSNQETTEFFKRNGKAPRPGLYFDRDAESTCPKNEADAIRILFELLEQVEKDTERTWQKQQAGELRPDSYAYSVDLLLDAVISKCGSGRPGLALEDIFHLGKLYAYLQLEDREEHAEKGRHQKQYQSQGGRARAKLTRQQRIDAAQKFHELHATSGMSKTAALKRIGDEFGVSRQTIGRIVNEYSSEK